MFLMISGNRADTSLPSVMDAMVLRIASFLRMPHLHQLLDSFTPEIPAQTSHASTVNSVRSVAQKSRPSAAP